MPRTVILVVLLALAACGSPPKPAEPTTAGAQKLVPPGEAKIGDRSICLVNKEEFVVTEHSPKVEHEGKTYYFCCPGCDTKFKADPKKYLGGS